VQWLGAHALATLRLAASSSLSHLKELSLSHNPIVDADVALLLSATWPLQRLLLVDCLLIDRAVAQLDVSLLQSAALRHLDLSLNHCIGERQRIKVHEAWVASDRFAAALAF